MKAQNSQEKVNIETNTKYHAMVMEVRTSLLIVA